MIVAAEPLQSGRPGRLLGRRPAASVAAMLLALTVLVCGLGSLWARDRFAATHLEAARLPPTASAPFGTDLLGRSLLPRCLLGGAVSLGVGAAAAAFSVVLGVLWGSIAGMAGGRIDAFMMRIVDVLYGLPYLLLVILLKIGLGGLLTFRLGLSHGVTDAVVLMLAIGGVSWLTMARIVRTQVLSLRARPFVEAARAIGVGPVGIWRTHLLPNLAGPIIAYSTLTIPQAILQESFLSFLGIGIQPPMPSWGNLAAEGVAAINSVQSFWWLLAFPCGMLSLTLLALNIVGDALQATLSGEEPA
jgi:ABC-type dipeptide/oligopeptide/nickel transport system permease subunit